MKGFKVDKEWIERNVLSNQTVQSALNAKARRIAPIVKRIALKEGDRHYAESVSCRDDVLERNRRRICADHMPESSSATSMRTPRNAATDGSIRRRDIFAVPWPRRVADYGDSASRLMAATDADHHSMAARQGGD